MNNDNYSDEISLRILEQIQSDPAITQRDLSSKLGIALGLTNAYIKRLVKKGYIKIRNLNGRRIMYILTPKGIVEKTKLTCNYMARSFNYFKEIKHKIDKTYAQALEAGDKRIILWGSDELAELCYIASKGLPVGIVGVVSLNGRERFYDCEVYGKDMINNIDFDAILAATFEPKELAELENIKAKVYYLWQN
ncbi:MULTISPECIES: winged helix-turn-helix transcriptional regulator [Thermodesulfovibrio]|jgi:DNA-binding MarR family transcriptional regulator|uniref:winged helix-turn-helix transcriptional regulator n=1 Tax=Thermodesulfovibrio TaxID=28261 RepID=UPI002633BF20|nr:winged helix-turn-helix transcriptional regulator [Thermodesulfovibrio sp.]